MPAPRMPSFCTLLGGGPTGRAYEVALLPQGGDGDAEVSVLLVARDVTADRNLTKALIASRQLFKDLVDCSADFAWETGADGRFGFVSPRGALGFEKNVVWRDGRSAKRWALVDGGLALGLR